MSGETVLAAPAEAEPPGLSTHQMVRLIDLPPETVRDWVRSGLVECHRRQDGRLAFSIRAVAFLRTVKRLLDQGISTRRLRRILRQLQHQLGPGSSLTSLRLSLVEGRVLAMRDGLCWDAESGRAMAEPPPDLVSFGNDQQDDDEGGGLQAADPIEVELACRRRLALDPDDVEARVALAGICSETGRGEEAAELLRGVLETRPDDAAAACLLGSVLAGMGQLRQAVAALRRALTFEPGMVAAHLELAALYRRMGRHEAARRHEQQADTNG